jgi:hypothetical protein
MAPDVFGVSTAHPQVMCADYGFRSGNMRLYQDEYGSVPGNVFTLVRQSQSCTAEPGGKDPKGDWLPNGDPGQRCSCRQQNFTSQGIENFKKEFEQLRRAFRYDEFETVTNANPPSNSIQKVLVLLSCSSQPACLRWCNPDV